MTRTRQTRLFRLAFTAIFAPILALSLATILGLPAPAQRAHPLLIYAIDVEGGQSTLIVSPSGASMLVDTGWPTPDARDARRIQAAMHDAGITRLDHVFITHFHVDHVGGVPNLVASGIPVGEFLDHGPNREDSDITRVDYAAYLKAIEGKPRRIVHPGDTINLPGLEAIVLTADGEHIAAVPGVKPELQLHSAKAQSPTGISMKQRTPALPASCSLTASSAFSNLSATSPRPKRFPSSVPPTSSAESISISSTTTALTLSNSRAFVHAIHPRVAIVIMDNGATQSRGEP